jgi:hypothetical protein
MEKVMDKLKNNTKFTSCSAGSNDSGIVERIRWLMLAGLSALVISTLSACGSSSSDTGSTGGGATSCNDLSGEPDIMGQITFTPATAQPGDTVIIHIPIDADTAFVGAELTGISATGTIVGGSTTTLSDLTGYVTVASLGVQTLDVSTTILPGSSAGSYIPTINVCSVDINACKHMTGSGGVAVNYASNPIFDNTPLSRFKYFESGSEITPSVSNLPVDSCVTRPTLTVTTP